ncbi:hypothetical protein EZS27_015954, partial [termite gut metagenome]
GDYLLQFDGEKTIAVYRFKTDKLLKENLSSEIDSSVRERMEESVNIPEAKGCLNVERVWAKYCKNASSQMPQ